MHELMSELLFTIYHAMGRWGSSSGGTDGYQPPYYLEIEHEGWRITPGLKDALSSKSVGLWPQSLHPKSTLQIKCARVL